MDFNHLLTAEGLAEVAADADGIGAWIKQMVSGNSVFGNPELTSLVSDAQSLRMRVFPYTIRSDALPGLNSSFEELLNIMFKQAKVDGVFTDFPDKVRSFLKFQI